METVNSWFLRSFTFLSSYPVVTIPTSSSAFILASSSSFHQVGHILSCSKVVVFHGASHSGFSPFVFPRAFMLRWNLNSELPGLDAGLIVVESWPSTVIQARNRRMQVRQKWKVKFEHPDVRINPTYLGKTRLPIWECQGVSWLHTTTEAVGKNEN